MKLQLTAPGKTFLLGEYAALQGGPSLVLTSAPCFELSVQQKPTGRPVIFEHIPQESPAGHYLLQHAEIFKGYHLIFHDPYHGLGGFGASSAQFLLVAALKKLLDISSIKITYSAQALLNEYWPFAWNGEGIKPSGADLIAQAQGGISYFYQEQQRLKTLSWPFPEIDYYLIHTGHKVATHQHLKELTSLTTHQLSDIVFAGLQHLQTQNADGFINSINQYAQVLQKLDLVLNKTTELLQIITQRPEVLAAKGCGALGADVILVLVKTSDQTVFTHWLKEKKLNLITHSNKTNVGLQITTDMELSL